MKQIGEKYSFYHDFVMEVTTHVCCSEHPEEAVDFADVSFLRKRFSIGKYESNDSFTILLEHTHIEILVNRLIKELIGDCFMEVILSPCMRNEQVIGCFKQHLNDLSDHEMLKLITKSQKTEINTQKIQHIMNESWYTRLEFASLQMECSPLFAMITFCHDDLSKFCLNLLEKTETGLRRKMLASFSEIPTKKESVLKKKNPISRNMCQWQC